MAAVSAGGLELPVGEAAARGVAGLRPMDEEEEEAVAC